MTTEKNINKSKQINKAKKHIFKNHSGGDVVKGTWDQQKELQDGQSQRPE